MGRPPCCDKSNVKKGPWTPEEDAKILAYVSNHGVGNWTLVPKKAGLNRCGKSCRLRWTNYLRPDLKHDGFSAEEEELIIKFHEAVGSRWSLIAKQLPGRTDNDVKNFWNTKVKKKLIKMGIDPITHKPVSQILSDYGNISNILINNQSAPSFNNSNTNSTSVTSSEPNSLPLPTTNHQQPGVLLQQQVIQEDEAIPTINDHFWSDYLLLGDPFWSSNNELEEEEEEREHHQSELQDSSSVSSNNSSHPTIHKELPPRCCFLSSCKHNYYTDDSNNDYNHQVKIENRRRTVYRQGSAAEGETNKQYAAASSSSSSAAAVNSFVESILDSDCKMRSEFPALLGDESFEY